MKVLGIYDGHNSNASLVIDGEIVAAIEEERFSRIKNHDSRIPGNNGPVNAVTYCLELTDADDIDLIALALEDPFTLSVKSFNTFVENLKTEGGKRRAEFLRGTERGIFQKYGVDTVDYFSLTSKTQSERVENIKSILATFGLSEVPVIFVNHHMAHHASVYYTSGKTEGLCLSLDGRGDNLSGSVATAAGGSIEMLSEIDSLNSIGHFYSAITVASGFRAIRHEGKITGLAAFGKVDDSLLKEFRNIVYFSEDKKISTTLADDLVVGPYPHANFRGYIDKIEELVDGYDRETVAATAQHILQEVSAKWAKYWIDETGENNVFLSGGVFANVRLNQIIFELEGVEKINVHPGMTDAGLGVGAALYGYHHFRNALGLDYEPYALSNVYFGSEFSKEEIRETLESEGVIYHEPEDLNKTIAKLLAEDKVVGRFTGRMEYGPRALGNRSILYSTKDKSVNDWLNKQLDRTEFMPFAPVTLEEFADDCYLVGEGKKEPFDTARFMTITFDCTEEMKKKSPAVVHIDGTARPQVIRKEDNEDYHEILMEYQKLTGIPSLVNTSFNLHEEPIVENPAQALHAFKQSKLDVLSIGPFVVYQDENE